MAQVLLHEPHHPVSPLLLVQMFRLRHQVFKLHLGWDVVSRHGMERDRYDDLAPIYALCRADDGKIVGCWRLLPTTRPYLMKDTFPELLGEHPAPSSSTVWEATRFTCSAGNQDARSLRSIRRDTFKLIAALLETGFRYGLTQIVAVTDVCFERLLKRSGLATHRLGPEIKMGNTGVVAGWFEVTEENLRRVRAVGGLTEAVLPAWPAQTKAA